MSGLPATFDCPWCGMGYPAKPVLVGKAVRCKSCRNAFVLQPTGVALKVEDPPPVVAAPPPAPPAPVVSAPPPAPPALVVPEPIARVEPAPAAPPPPPVVRTPPPKPSERIPKRKTEQLAAARAQMSAQLAEVAAKAAKAEEARQPERKSERIGKPAGTPKPGQPGTSRVVLTGHGERQHRELRGLWMGVAGVAVVVLLLAVTLNLRSAVRAALDEYAAPVPAEQNRYPVLGDTIRARAWLVSAPSMPAGPALASELSDASIGPEQVIEFAPLAEALGELKGLRLDQALGAWLAPADIDRARAATAGRVASQALRALVEARIRHVPHAAVVQRFGLDEEAVRIVVDLLMGTAPRDGEPVPERLLDRGELPDRLVFRTFRGRSGTLLIDIGRPPYRVVTGPYVGSLVRFEGDRWPIGWRLLHLAQQQ